MPTRFNYRQGEAVDFGISAEQMLLIDDADLRKLIPMSLESIECVLYRMCSECVVFSIPQEAYSYVASVSTVSQHSARQD